MRRPTVSVIVPFHGDEADARSALAALERLELKAGDELLIADNTHSGVLAAISTDGFAAAARRQPYSARNEAARRASGDWLLFVDADCRPRPGLLDAYFAPAPGPQVGALAGEVASAPARTLAQRYAADRRLLSSEVFIAHPHRPMAVTANLLVRRAAFEAVGGFHERIRSGGDADLCWRLQDAGWLLERRAAAVVEHEHRATIRGLLRQVGRTAAGARWLERRHPGFRQTAGAPARAARALIGMATWPLRGRPERGLFKAVELAVIAVEALGRLAGNARRGEVPAVPEVWVVDEPSAQPSGYVEARARALGAVATTTPGAEFAEDDGPLRRLVAAIRLTARRPRAALRHRRLLLDVSPGVLRARARGAGIVRGDGARAVAFAALSGLPRRP